MKQKVRMFHIMNSLLNVYSALTGATLILYLYSFVSSPIKVNMLIAIAVISTFLFEVPSGAISDRWGNRPVLLLCGISLALANILFIFLRAYWIAALAQVFAGASSAFLSGAIDSWLFDDPNFDRNNIQSICIDKYKYQSAVFIVGGLVGGIIADINTKLVFFVSLIASSIYLVLVLKYVSGSDFEKDVFSGKHYLLDFGDSIKATIDESFKYCIHSRRIIHLLIFNGIITFTTATVFVNWSPLLNQLGGSNYSIMGVAWMLMQLSLLGGNAAVKLLKGEPTNYFPIVAALLGGCVILIVAFDLFYASFASLLLFEFILGIINPLKEATLNNEISVKARATILSFQSMIANIMYYLSLLLSAWLTSSFSSSFAWLVSGSILVIGSIIYWFVTKET